MGVAAEKRPFKSPIQLAQYSTSFLLAIKRSCVSTPEQMTIAYVIEEP